MAGRMFVVVLNEEVLPEEYPTEDAAREAAASLAAKFEAERGVPAPWFVTALPKPH